MSRDIEYRGISEKTGKWIYGSLVTYGEGRQAYIVDGLSLRRDYYTGYNTAFEKIEEVVFDSVGQRTGLTDKNGTRIFENDIVKRDDGSKGKYRRFAVVQISPDISFDCSRIEEIDGVKNSSSHTFHFGSFIYTDTHNHLEIVGNLYEHPSLLSESKHD